MSIIAVLAGMSLFAVQGSRESARDARRKADLESIRSAIEIFKADCNVYPSSLPAVDTQLRGVAGLGCAPANTNVYMESIPGDPADSGAYYYNRITTTTYRLCAELEDPPATPMTCTGGGMSNYEVRNP